MKIILSPFSQKLRNGKTNPKNYPYWREAINLLSDHELIQIGRTGEEKLIEDARFDLSMPELRELINDTHFFIGVDNFFPHFCHYYGKNGAVLFSKSDPEIYGYPGNLNLLKDRSYLRPDQFGLWESCDFDPEAFITAEQLKINLENSRFFSIL